MRKLDAFHNIRLYFAHDGNKKRWHFSKKKKERNFFNIQFSFSFFLMYNGK